ncbi:FGGY family carbohydrate kinase [Chitinophaga sp. MM2321]|uniref:FGGY-family carbohydrate kinase n=1 Tax=Chitinophaga sp. MM2321 TaxID=3137178 RepID=UPI0032D58DDB
MQKRMPVVAVFDIGKTNKKLLVFDEHYRLIKEEVYQFEEIMDDDGFPCEDLGALSTWVLTRFQELKTADAYQLKAVNFSTYGASMVYIDAAGKPLGYLYNYVKPYPEAIWHDFVEKRGTADAFSVETCSPLMGHLNAGMQLYWIKYEKPALYQEIATALHFPQYLSYLLTGNKVAEMTNVGCHSAMWDFRNKQYHSWLKEEGLLSKLCTITPGNVAVKVKNEATGEDIAIGTGLHDSSAAMVPYLQCFTEPFMILSTGTWSISLNPFNNRFPDEKELAKGCVSYLSYQGNPVKVAMLFSGNDHDLQVKRIAGYFNVSADFYKTVLPDEETLDRNRLQEATADTSGPVLTNATTPCKFHTRNLAVYTTPAAAYHQLVSDIIQQQKASSNLVLEGSDVSYIFVDGGFCKNTLYMQLLAAEFPHMKFFAASMTQGTALGAALVLHQHWNALPVPPALLQLKKYEATGSKALAKK